jgi:hypothetical protein
VVIDVICLWLSALDSAAAFFWDEGGNHTSVDRCPSFSLHSVHGASNHFVVTLFALLTFLIKFDLVTKAEPCGVLAG